MLYSFSDGILVCLMMRYETCTVWTGIDIIMYFLVFIGRTPQSLIAGLMWIGITNGRYAMRHICQDSDELRTYGWTEHNGRDYGHQILVDQDMTLKTSFLKSKEHGSSYGGDWAVRIEVENDE